MNELHYGVVVGIDRYPRLKHAGHLKFARSDAKRFHEWLVSPSGGALPDENADLLNDPPRPLSIGREPYPAQRHVNDVFTSCAAAVQAHARPGEAAWQNTRIYVYVAGHGYAPSDGVAALLLADAADGQLGYHLEISRYVAWLVKAAIFREVLVFSDCCRRQYSKAALSATVPFEIKDLAEPVEVFSMIGYAARVGEDALEPEDAVDPDQARGVFTGAVLDGLAGAAADGGVVTSSRLAVFVRSAVETRTAQAKVPQKVEFPGDLSQQIELCRVDSPPVRKVMVRFPDGADGQAQIENGSFEVVARHHVSDGTWTLDLQDGFYELTSGVEGSRCEKLFKVAGEDIDVEAG
jgi:uncharacterized caspase-like protein